MPTMGVTLSVITITRNDLAGLVHTIQSVRNLLGLHIEHLVIDGASTDGSAEYLSSLPPTWDSGASSFSYLSEPDDGIYSAMNKGLARAKGDVIVFMNSGDVFGPTSAITRVMHDYATTPFAWAFGSVDYVDAHARRIRSVHQPYNKRLLTLGLRFVPHQSTYMSTKLLQAIGGFNSKYGMAADQAAIIRAAMIGPPIEYNVVLSRFLVGGAHTRMSRWAQEWAYHTIRKDNQVLLGGLAWVDAVYCIARFSYRASRDVASRIKHQRRLIGGSS